MGWLVNNDWLDLGETGRTRDTKTYGSRKVNPGMKPHDWKTRQESHKRSRGALPIRQISLY